MREPNSRHAELCDVGNAGCVIETLRQEHLELLALVGLCVDVRAERRRSAVSSLCLAIRMHYTLEIGVFIPAIARARRDEMTLDHAASDYAEMIAIVNEMGDSLQPARPVDLELIRLNEHLIKHVRATEVSGGAFDVAREARIDWPALARTLRVRKSDLWALFRNIKRS